MNIQHAHDEEVAHNFWDASDCIERFDRYVHEMDEELRHDFVKSAWYVLCREQGVEPMWANMRACRRASGCVNTDRHFNETYRRKMEAMPARNRDAIVQLAQQAGISTTGKFYVGGLGRYTDPGAWCSTIDDVVSVAKKRHLTLSGAVRYQAPTLDPPKPVRMAPDLMKDFVRRYTKADPVLAERVKRDPRKLRELKERILHTHTKAKKVAHG